MPAGTGEMGKIKGATALHERKLFENFIQFNP
jgi:hypothetical protein